jgi:hypothetical protein
MSSPSNLYAEKVYAEHPLALWALDEGIDYLSLITEQQRDFEGWTITGVSDQYEGVINNAPFEDSIVNTFEGNANALVTLISPNLVSLSSLQERLRTFCIGTYYYSNSDNYDYIEIGYQYIDSETSLVVQNLKRFTSIVQDQWAFISETFEIPSESNQFKIVIKIKLNNNGSNPSDYIFNFNGLSAGQWSEEFNTTSLGANSINLPSTVGLTESSLKCIESNSYGNSINKGYYLVANNILTSRNTSIPLVYGSSGVIRLFPNYSTVVENIIDGGGAVSTTSEFIDGGNPSTELIESFDGGIVVLSPSYIVPGLGLLNEDGKYKEYTLEFWTRIDCNSSESHRLVGPIGSNDGIYVEGGHITLVIGNSFRSYYVGQWIRPMLFHMTISKTLATLMINGEEVINMQIDLSQIDLPNKNIILEGISKDQDYIGFYCYPDIPSFEIDSVAIYSYKVPSIVAKRRYVYGQGVGSSELINNSYAGTEAFIDYTFSEYTANYSYPDFAKWNQGSFDNLITDNLSLTTPQYELPTIYFNNKTVSEFYTDCKSSQILGTKFISFRPNSTWNTTSAYINFPRLDILQSVLKMIYVVYSVDDAYSGDQIILKIYNSQNNNTFTVLKQGTQIKYLFNYNNSLEQIYAHTYTNGVKHVAGIKIDALGSSYDNVYSFFSNTSSLKMYVGGDNTGNYTFGGKIYAVGFGTNYNASLFENFTNGIASYNQAQYFIDKLASYTLLPTDKYNSFFLDIGVSGYWEDYLPLSYFAKYVTDEYGYRYYDLDFLQFNIDAPSPSEAVRYETTSEWTYQELDSEFDSPIQQTYLQLDNNNYTGWDNYQDMNEKSDDYRKYDISESEVKSYVTMQYILDGSNLLQNNFTTTNTVDENKVIDFSKHSGWSNHKFEVLDNSIIYPPANVDFNDLAIVYRIEFSTRNTLNRPIAIKKLQIASQSLDHNKFNKVGTKFGTPLYPYTRSGIYYDFKTKNPFAISKTSSPYLYATQSSGIEIRNEYEVDVDKGVSLPVNIGKSSSFQVAAIQFWMRSNKTKFPAVRQKIFEMNYLSDTIEFFVQANSENGDRAKIFGVSKKTNMPFTSLTYYINGNFVREPVISRKEWVVIGMSFENNISFDGMLGSINITGPYMFNNISYYQATNLQLAQSRTLRSWSKVKTVAPTEKDWEDWLSYTWNQILVLGTSNLYGTSPSDIYKTYIGTNKIIIDDNEGISINPDTIKMYQDATWQSFIVTPV